MVVATVGGCEERVTVLIMQQDECSTSQHRRQPPHQSSRDQRLGVHRLAMSIDVEGGGLAKGFLYWRMPQLSRPSSKHIGQRFSLIRLGHLREQPLGVAVAVGSFSTTYHREPIASVTAQIPGPMEPNEPKKQQGQHQHPARVA